MSNIGQGKSIVTPNIGRLIGHQPRGGGSSTLLDNLVSWWTLDEASGIRYDSHGSNNLSAPGTDLGNTTGKVGNCSVHTDTVNCEFRLSGTTFNPGDTDWTMAFWVRQSSFATNNAVLAKWDGFNNSFLLGNTGSTATLKFWINGLGASGPSVSVSSANTWYHIVFYHDSVNNEVGIIVNDGTPVTTAWSGGIPSNSAQLQVGQYENDRGINGNIDELGWWSRILTASEITELFNSGSGITYSDM